MCVRVYECACVGVAPLYAQVFVSQRSLVLVNRSSGGSKNCCNFLHKFFNCLIAVAVVWVFKSLSAVFRERKYN